MGIEIEAALKRDIHIIPVLVDGAEMPCAQDLPDSLKLLARRNAVRLTHERFRADSAGLVKSLKKSLKETEAKRQRAAEEAARNKAREEEERRKEEEAERARQLEQANWEFIKAREDESLLRNHLARHPETDPTRHWALDALENLLWQDLGEQPDLAALTGFLDEFSEGIHAKEAWRLQSVLTPGDINSGFVFFGIPSCFVLMALFDVLDWSFLGSGKEAEMSSGFVVGFVLLMVVAAVLINRRGFELSEEEMMGYWGICSMAGVLAFAGLFEEMNWSFFGYASGPGAGWLAALALSAGAGAGLWLFWWQHRAKKRQ